jgi:uncharacterized membrane protein YhaH (DUF805 family)
MDIATALTGFRGRLSRKPYWIASLVLLVVVVAAIVAITFVAVETMDPDVARWPALLLQLAIIYPASAVMVKRFQDRNRSGWMVLLLVVPALLLTIGDVAGLLGEPIPLSAYDGVDFDAGFFTLWTEALKIEFQYRPVDVILNFWLIAVTIWFVIELGFLRGTPGPNPYGADPLAAPLRG